MFCAMRRRMPTTLMVSTAVLGALPGPRRRRLGRAGDIGVEILVGDASRGSRAAHEAQIDARFARFHAHGGRGERLLARRTRRACLAAGARAAALDVWLLREARGASARGGLGGAGSMGAGLALGAGAARAAADALSARREAGNPAGPARRCG